ncbi:YncE family protein [Streptomyces adonidis]|uniref:YncE family protein n=1 Tax=Streptomyces adonidis TaxID=3231367 RepID=UPI0034DB02D2
MRSTSAATALAVIFSSAALSVLGAGPASAATAVVSGPGGLVVDGTLKRVFVGDSGGGRILATDYSGTVVDSVSGLGSVTDLALSDDGATLYVVVVDRDSILALDTATLDIKAHYRAPFESGPRHIAFTGGRVWFTYGGRSDANLGSIDPTVDPASGTDPVTTGLFPADAAPGVRDQVILDTDPSAPGLLAVGQNYAANSMAVLDVSDGTPKVTAWHDGTSTSTYGIGDIDFVPGTSEVLVNGTKRYVYADGGFSAAGSYPAGWQADIAPNGLVVQGIGGTSVAVYRQNAVQPLRTYPVGFNDLAWAPDASRIFVLEHNGNGFALRTLTDPTKNVPTLTVNAPAKGTRTKPLTVTGRISATVPLPAGTKLQVTRTDLDSPSGHALPSVMVKADGTYSFTNSPPAGGTVTYKVSYAGDAEHVPAAASDKVEVSRTTPALTLNNNKKTYDYGKDVSFTAHLGATYKNRTVEIWVDPYGTDRPKKLLKTGKVNSAGNLSATVDMTRDMVVTAVFKGDARYAPRTVRSTAYGRARVSTAVSKHYRTGRIGSQSYYWFHKNTDPVLTTTMNYYPGRKQRLDLQVFYQGSWHTTASEYFAVATNGKSAVQLGAPGEAGIKARVRSVYVDGASGDNVNSTAYGSWKYLYFSN